MKTLLHSALFFLRIIALFFLWAVFSFAGTILLLIGGVPALAMFGTAVGLVASSTPTDAQALQAGAICFVIAGFVAAPAAFSVVFPRETNNSFFKKYQYYVCGAAMFLFSNFMVLLVSLTLLSFGLGLVTGIDEVGPNSIDNMIHRFPAAYAITVLLGALFSAVNAYVEIEDAQKNDGSPPEHSFV